MSEIKMNKKEEIKAEVKETFGTKVKNFLSEHKWDIAEALLIGSLAGISNYVGQKNGFNRGRKLGNWEGILRGTQMPDAKKIVTVSWIPQTEDDILQDECVVDSLNKLGLKIDDVAKVNKVINVITKKDQIK